MLGLPDVGLVDGPDDGEILGEILGLVVGPVHDVIGTDIDVTPHMFSKLCMPRIPSFASYSSTLAWDRRHKQLSASFGFAHHLFSMMTCWMASVAFKTTSQYGLVVFSVWEKVVLSASIALLAENLALPFKVDDWLADPPFPDKATSRLPDNT